MNILKSYDILTIQYPNGTWYYANKKYRQQFYIKQNKQLWDKKTRIKWHTMSLSSGSNNIL